MNATTGRIHRRTYIFSCSTENGALNDRGCMSVCVSVRVWVKVTEPEKRERSFDRRSSSFGAFGWMKSPRSSIMCWANCNVYLLESQFLSRGNTETRADELISALRKGKPAGHLHVLAQAHTHRHTHTKRLSPKVRTPVCSCSHRETRSTASPLSFFIVCLWCPMCAHWLSFNPSQHTHKHTLTCMHDANPSFLSFLLTG